MKGPNGLSECTFAQREWLWTSEGRSTGETERASFMRALCCQVSDSWKCYPAPVQPNPMSVCLPAPQGKSESPSRLISQLCLLQASACPLSGPSFFAPGFWQSSDLNILKGQSCDFLRGSLLLLLLLVLVLFHVYTLVEKFFST